MTKIKFSCAIKYNGKTYPAYEPFNIDDDDVEALRKEGGTIIETEKTKKEASKKGKSKSK